MKKLFILVSILAIGTTAFAAPAKTASKSAPSAHYSGTIEKYDAGTHTLTIKHGDKDSTFQINDKSQVMTGKTKADVSALGSSTGQAVKVEYTLDGATKVAEKVDVAAASPTKKK